MPTGRAWPLLRPISARTASASTILPGAKDSIRFRASLFHFLDISPFQTTYLFSSRTFDRPNQSSSINWTHTFSPTLIMETTIAASRDQVFIRMTDTPEFDRTKYGLNYPYIFTGKDRPNKLPAIALTPFNDYSGSPYPSNSTGPIYTATTNLTKIVNNHTLKFGFAFERSGQNDYDQINVQGVPGGTDNQNGRFEFSDVPSRRHRRAPRAMPLSACSAATPRSAFAPSLPIAATCTKASCRTNGRPARS